jgi:hypothetical protein
MKRLDNFESRCPCGMGIRSVGIKHPFIFFVKRLLNMTLLLRSTCTGCKSIGIIIVTRELFADKKALHAFCERASVNSITRAIEKRKIELATQMD